MGRVCAQWHLPLFPLFQKGDSGGETEGLFTKSGEYYAVYVYSQSRNRDAWRIAYNVIDRTTKSLKLVNRSGSEAFYRHWGGY